MSNLPTISIIIPSYNEAKYLPLLFESIKNQTLAPKEVIVVAGQSNDGTEKIVKQYGYTLVPEKNDGPAKARNQGAKISKGELLIFLDADVIFPPKFFKDSVIEMVEKQLRVASCFAAPISLKKSDKILHAIANTYLKLTQKFFIHGSGFCIFVYKDLNDKIKGFDETLYLAEDHDFVQRAAKIGKFGYLQSHRVHVSVRRFEEEGRFTIAKKYFLAELHLFFLGKIKKPIYDYKFGKHNK